MSNLNDFEGEFEDFRDDMKNDEMFQSFWNDNFDQVCDKGTGWYLSTCTTEQLKILSEGAKTFLRCLVKQLTSDKDCSEELAKESLKNKDFSIFINVALNCISQESDNDDLNEIDTFRFINTFNMILQFELCLREGVINKKPEYKDKYMYVTNIEETFTQFTLSDKGKEKEKDSVINSLCMN